MSRLFISTYFDEDVSVLVCKLVRSRGFTVQTTLEAGRLGANDADQLAYAVERQMAILTHNRAHFESLASQYTATGKRHCGIIIAIRRPPYAIASRLLALLNRTTAEEMDGQLVFL
ncbi:MAG: DUF5615 family PIN-like protein [Tepidisphaeraceae bacterium]